ncbi:MAG: sulfotransferase [Gammaproteobacteria bacterium]|nr:sulfotransferase [Gammaproteobacteria bacterium]
MTEKPKLLYILAPSYSGSTLLTQLLGQHKRIATIGELKATRMGDIDRYRCSCGDMIRQCEFWNEVTRRATEAGARFSVDDFGTVYAAPNQLVSKIVRATVRRPGFEILRALLLRGLPEGMTRVRHVTRQNFLLGRIICDLQGGDIFLDGSKDSVRLLHFIESELWDVRVIYMQRDGRGVSNSYRKHDGLTYDAAVSYWRHSIRELQRMRRRLDDTQVFDLLYEDLCKAPETVMSDIWQWLGVEQQPIRSLDSNVSQSHILGNAMRLKNVAEIRFDESWKSKLSRDNLGFFESAAGELNRQLGYR